MVERLIETPGATFAIARVGEATRGAARAGCTRLLKTLGPNGIPNGQHTSTAHSGRWIAVGMSREFEVGVDVEVARSLPRRERMADWLGFDCADEASFWPCWTLRESLAKCMKGSVLVREDAELSLLRATRSHGEWVEAGGFRAQCGCLDGDIYYSLVLRRPAPDETHHCA